MVTLRGGTTRTAGSAALAEELRARMNNHPG
jgi:hypothetical protein